MEHWNKSRAERIMYMTSGNAYWRRVESRKRKKRRQKLQKVRFSAKLTIVILTVLVFGWLLLK